MVWQQRRQKPFKELYNRPRGQRLNKPLHNHPRLRSKASQHKVPLLHLHHKMWHQDLSLLRAPLLKHHQWEQYCIAINAEHAIVPASASATNAATDSHNRLFLRLLHQKLVCRDDFLHLPLISTSIRVIALGKSTIATLDLLRSRCRRKTQDSEGLLALH